MYKNYKYMNFLQDKISEICNYSLGNIRESSLSCWSETAILCYSSGCNCQACHLLDNLELTKTQCKMKYAVVELVRRFGKPKEIR